MFVVILVRTETGATGLEVVKEATAEADLDRLRREGTVLRRAAHPGVVELVAEAPGELRLRYHGTPLALLGPLPADRSLACVRAVGETVADLHRLGIAHGRIRADHVVVDERGRPRLCGFADAGEATEEARATDVADLGRLLAQLLDGGAGIPWSQLGGWRRSAQRRRGLRRMRSLAAAAQRHEPSRRPTARQFSAGLHHALPRLPPSLGDRHPAGVTVAPSDREHRSGPAEPGGWTTADLALLAETVADDDEFGPGPDERAHIPADATTSLGGRVPTVATRPTSARGPRRIRALVAGLVLVGGVVFGSTVARALRPFGSARLGEATSVAASPAPGGPRPVPRPPACPETAPGGPDLDGDGCPDPLTLHDRVASIGEVRIELGRPGDLAVVADSDCDGVATPVVLRPSTGEVFVFDEWITDAAVEVSATAVVPGARTIVTGDGRCGPVAVAGEGVHRVILGGDR